MKKIPTIWKRDPANPRRVVFNDWTDGVTDEQLGEAIATAKWDGTCLMLDDDGQWWARRTVKKGKPEPPNWVYVDTDGDKRQGWEPLEQSSFFDIFESWEGIVWWLDGEPYAKLKRADVGLPWPA